MFAMMISLIEDCC